MVVGGWQGEQCTNARAKGGQYNKYTHTAAKKLAQSVMEVAMAVWRLGVGKALGLVGAGLNGGEGGQILVSIAHIEADY
ncbi:UNVERIFIED_CONTAM: hypothetical protein DV095_10880, partial [Bifidobacterium breve]|nr:hypothetical protein [Bifidobacterium breve]